MIGLACFAVAFVVGFAIGRRRERRATTRRLVAEDDGPFAARDP